MPEIAIVIPAKNPGPEIIQTLESIAFQKAAPDQVILFDNNSDFDVQQYVLENTKHISIAIEYHRSEVANSMGESWTKACNYSKCEWTILLPADDLLLPSAISEIREAIYRFPTSNLIFGNMQLLVRNNIKISLGKSDGTVEKLENQKPYLQMKVKGRNLIGGTACVAFRTNKLKELMPWNSDLNYLTDMDMYVKFLRLPGNCVQINKNIAVFRIHSQSLTGKLGTRQLEQVKEFWKKTFYSNVPKIPFSVSFRIYVLCKFRLVFQRLLGA